MTPRPSYFRYLIEVRSSRHIHVGLMFELEEMVAIENTRPLISIRPG